MKNLLRRKQPQAISTLIIVIAVLATVVGLGLSTGIAGAASLNGRAAQRVPLTRTNIDCFGNVIGTPMTVPFGFAIINKTRSGKLIAEVSLKHARPNTTYNVRLIQTPSGSDCGVVDGTLTTNVRGNGNAHIQEAVLAGSTGAFVALNRQTGFSDFYTTRDVIFR